LNCFLKKSYRKIGLLKKEAICSSLNFILISLIEQSRLGQRLKIGKETSNLRGILRFFSALEKVTHDTHVDISNTEINDVKVRIYRPKAGKEASSNLPVMVYFHGGGYIFGSIDSFDQYLIEFAKRLSMLVVSVDYRMAPQHAYPTPTNDCYSVARYIIENPSEFSVDTDRLVLAGDSAGGNAVAVLIQRLMDEELKLPKLQVLIYPWVQLFNVMLPSMVEYSKKSIIGATMTIEKLYLWYMGLTDVHRGVIHEIRQHSHVALLEDVELKNKIRSYLDVDRIPEKYKIGRSYYEEYAGLQTNAYPETLPETSVFKRDENLASLMRQLYDPTVSPLFADKGKLTGQPKAYVIILGGFLRNFLDVTSQ
jgi:acetyl esterase/lipase